MNLRFSLFVTISVLWFSACQEAPLTREPVNTKRKIRKAATATAPLLKVYVNKKGKFLSGRIISNKQTHDKGLQPDSLNRVARHIKMLTTTDFEQPGLNIADDGRIWRSPL